ncbi:MAG: c-type cytochrome [Solirubrobacterales bacterium]
MERRKKLIIRPLLAFVALLVAVVVAGGCGTTTADTDRGRELFKLNCGNCHTLAQAGTAAEVGPDLDAAFAAGREVGQTDSTIEGIVKAQVEYPRPANGNPAASMPKGILTGQDLEDVAAYVGLWAGVPGAEPPKVPGGPGAQVFANNGCGSCHTLAAANSGGTAGPNLDEVLVAGMTAEEIHESIVDPNAQIAEGFSENVMPANYGETISEEELEELVEFLLENTPAGEGSGG